MNPQHEWFISLLVCLTDSLRYGREHLSDTAMLAILDDIEAATTSIRKRLTPPTAS